jgi:hypothetical protein
MKSPAEHWNESPTYRQTLADFLNSACGKAMIEVLESEIPIFHEQMGLDTGYMIQMGARSSQQIKVIRRIQQMANEPISNEIVEADYSEENNR